MVVVSVAIFSAAKRRLISPPRRRRFVESLVKDVACVTPNEEGRPRTGEALLLTSHVYSNVLSFYKRKDGIAYCAQELSKTSIKRQPDTERDREIRNLEEFLEESVIPENLVSLLLK